MQDEDNIGSGRFARKRPPDTGTTPRALLGRIAATVNDGDARAIDPSEAKDLLVYLCLAGRIKGLTWAQLDAFWDMNAELLETKGHLKDAEEELESYEHGKVTRESEGPTEAAWWLEGLPEDQFETVVARAYEQYGQEFPSPTPLRRP